MPCLANGQGYINIRPTPGGTDARRQLVANDIPSLSSIYQPLLISGTNIKTVNSNSLVGSGNVSVGTLTSLTLTQPSAGLTITGTGTPITGTGTPVFALANDLAALEGLSSTGIARRTGVDTWTVGSQVDLPTEVTGQLPIANGSNFIAISGSQTGLSGDKQTTGTWTITPALAATTSLKLGISSNVSTNGELLYMRIDQSAGTFASIINANNGTASTATLLTSTSATLSAVTGIESLSATFSTSGIREAGKGVIRSNLTNGLNVGTMNSTPVSFFSNNILRGSFNSSGVFNVVNQAGTGARLVQASSTGDQSATLTVASSTYTPTLTSVTNVASSTAYVTGYLQIGTSVTVFGKVTIDVTTAGSTATELGFSLPVASNLAAEEDLGGAAESDVSGGLGIRIKADATNDRASFVFKAASASNDNYNFQFSYQVK